MGLYSKKLKFPKLKKIHYIFIKLFAFTTNNVFFLGEGEYKSIEYSSKFS